MDSDQWSVRQLCLEIYHLAPAERAAFLRERCADKPELIAQVNRLLDSVTNATVLALSTGGVSDSKAVPSEEDQRAFGLGEILAGRFRITRFITSGGMGQVYAAEDLNLGGEIAIKTVLPHFALEPAIVDRFRDEISLNLRITHPNVCRVFDLETHQTEQRRILFLTMELLEGQTLEEWIAKHGRIRVEEAAPIARQFLEGLRAAHRVGVIHQDFKPSNVFLVPQGSHNTQNGEGQSVRAVVMDFGLAHLPGASRARTLSDLIGTPIYMAPEQLEGGLGSISSDIYAVGLVLYEMVTGTKPFPSSPTTSPLRRTKLKPVSPREIVPDLDERWEKVILECLSPDPERRPVSVDAILQELGLEEKAKHQISVRRELLKVFGVALFFSLLSGSILWFKQSPEDKIDKLTVLTSETDLSADPSLSRDGKTIAYESDRAEPGNLDIWVQKLPDGNPRRITSDPAEDDDVNLSPDGSQVVFHSDRKGGGIYIADTAGGPERLLAPFGSRPRFSPDGKRVAFWTGDIDEATPSGQLFWVSNGGGSATRLAAGFADARFPLWSPDGRFLLFTGCHSLDPHVALSACQDWWVTSADAASLSETGALAALRRVSITPRYWPSIWSKDGVFFAGYRESKTDIWRLPLSSGSFRPSGKPTRIALGLSSAVDPTLAADRTIAFGLIRGAVHVWQLQLGPDKRSHRSQKLTNETESDYTPSISQNGRLLVCARGVKNRRGIWLRDLVTGRESQISGPARKATHPVVSFADKYIAYEADEKGSTAIYVAALDQPAQKICAGCGLPTGWFRDDRGVLFDDISKGSVSMVAYPDGKITPILSRAGFRIANAVWNPRTEFVVFTASSQNGRRQVFAAKLGALRAKVTRDWIPITNENGWSDRPQWSSDGTTIYFASTRDGFLCVWGQNFDPGKGTVLGLPFVVAHFHDPHSNPNLLVLSDFGMSVSEHSIVLNSGEAAETILTGIWRPASFFPRL